MLRAFTGLLVDARLADHASPSDDSVSVDACNNHLEHITTYRDAGYIEALGPATDIASLRWFHGKATCQMRNMPNSVVEVKPTADGWQPVDAIWKPSSDTR